MELKRLLLVVRQWIWLIVICTLAAGAGGLTVTLLKTPVYEASSTLRIRSAVVQNTSDYSTLLAEQRMALTYAQLLTEAPVLEGVIADLGLDTTAKSLRKSIKVQTVRDTELIRITVEGTDPLAIQTIANAIPRIFVAQDQALEASRYAQLKASLAARIANLEAEIRELQAAIASKKVAGIAPGDAELIRLESDHEQARANYATLLQNYGSVELAEAQTGISVVVATEAGLPSAPVSPQKAQTTLLAALVGALVGLGLAFLIQYMDDTIKTPDDVRAFLGIATLGTVPRTKDSKTASPLLSNQLPQSPLAETYWVLRTNLQFSNVDRPANSLMVTSAGPAEGKSTTAANLGMVMAQAGQKVILVDADLRRPSLHRLFELPNGTGLTSVLADETLNPADWLQETKVQDLRVITSGPLPPNPPEMLGSQRMQRLMARLKDMADVVLYDCPPTMAVADAAVLAKQVDGTLLVVNSGETRRSLAQQVVTGLKQAGANIVGVVLNRVSLSNGGYYYNHYADSQSPPGRNQSPRRFWARLGQRPRK